MDSIRTFLEAYGIWSVLLLAVAKFGLGVLVAIQKKEFKWFYLDNVLRNDGVKFAVFVGLSLFMRNEALTLSVGSLLSVGYTAGIIKNLNHIFPSLGDTLSSSFREPARLRLGNPKNIT